MTMKTNTQSFHSDATIARDGLHRVVWLKHIRTGKIYFNHNKQLTLSPTEIAMIEKDNKAYMNEKYSGGKKIKKKRTHRRH